MKCGGDDTVYELFMIYEYMYTTIQRFEVSNTIKYINYNLLHLSKVIFKRFIMLQKISYSKNAALLNFRFIAESLNCITDFKNIKQHNCFYH